MAITHEALRTPGQPDTQRGLKDRIISTMAGVKTGFFRRSPAPDTMGADLEVDDLRKGAFSSGSDGTPPPSLPTKKEYSPGDKIVADVLFNSLGNEVLTLEDMPQVLRIYANPKVLPHVDLPAPLPAKWDDEATREFTLAEVAYRDYFRGTNDDKGNFLSATPFKDVIGFKTLSTEGEIIAVGDIRLRGHGGFIPEGQRIANLEKVARLQRDDLDRMGVGRITTAKALDHVFYVYKGYSGGKGASAVRASIFFDSDAGAHNINSDWLGDLGFEVLYEKTDERGRRILVFEIKESKWRKQREQLKKVGKIDWDMPGEANNQEDIIEPSIVTPIVPPASY